MAICRTVSIIIILAADNVDVCDKPPTTQIDYRMNIANTFFLMCSSLFFFGVHIMMLLMITRSSKPLDDEKV